MTTGHKHQTALEENELCDTLRAKLDKVDEELAKQRATGHEKAETLIERHHLVQKYQAARIAADRPRVG